MRNAILMSLAAAALTAACHSSPAPEAPAPDPSEAEMAMHRHMMDSLDAVTRAAADSVEQILPYLILDGGCGTDNVGVVGRRGPASMSTAVRPSRP